MVQMGHVLGGQQLETWSEYTQCECLYQCVSNRKHQTGISSDQDKRLGSLALEMP